MLLQITVIIKQYNNIVEVEKLFHSGMMVVAFFECKKLSVLMWHLLYLVKCPAMFLCMYVCSMAGPGCPVDLAALSQELHESCKVSRD